MNGFLMEIVALIVSTSRVAKMKRIQLAFCREFSILCIEDRVVDHVV